MPPKDHYTDQKLPHPFELRTYKIPGYLMPVIAEWLQLSISSTYSILKAGNTPGASTIARLSNAPYNIHPSLWKKPAAFRGEFVYQIWYDIQNAPSAYTKEKAEEKAEEEQLLSQLLQ